MRSEEVVEGPHADKPVVRLQPRREFTARICDVEMMV
jgi:hypothetical protein